jgi:hypothetical protein
VEARAEEAAQVSAVVVGAAPERVWQVAAQVVVVHREALPGPSAFRANG